MNNRFGGSILAALILLVACWPQHAFAVQYGTNLLAPRNGNAEAGGSSPDAGPIPVPHWKTTGGFSVVPYGSGGYPSQTDPGPKHRGAQFFAGGVQSDISFAVQTIDLTANSADVSTGKVILDLSAYLGGYSSQTDSAKVEVKFRNGPTLLATTHIGPVTAENRNDATGLLRRFKSVPVPRHTKSMIVKVIMTRTGGTANDGYADNVSLVLRGPATVTNTEDSGPGSLRAAMSAGSEIIFDAQVFAPGNPQQVIALTNPLPVIKGDMRIVGPGAAVVKLQRSDAAAVAPFAILSVNNNDVTFAPSVWISGLTVSNGGTGISVTHCAANLTGVDVVGNALGIANRGSTVSLERCVVAGNTNENFATDGGVTKAEHCTISAGAGY